MNLLAWWRKSEASSGGKLVAVVAVEETPGTDPVPAPGNVITYLQRMVRAKRDGTLLPEGATAATALAPLATIGATVWVEAFDLANFVGCELQNDSDVDFLFVYATTKPADGGDFGLRLKVGANRFFAPPYEASYRGKVWVRAVSGTNKTLRRNAW